MKTNRKFAKYPGISSLYPGHYAHRLMFLHVHQSNCVGHLLNRSNELFCIKQIIEVALKTSFVFSFKSDHETNKNAYRNNVKEKIKCKVRVHKS